VNSGGARLLAASSQKMPHAEVAKAAKEETKRILPPLRLPHCLVTCLWGLYSPALRVLCGLCVRQLCLALMGYGFSCGFVH